MIFLTHSALLSGLLIINEEYIKSQYDLMSEKIYYKQNLDKFLILGQILSIHIINQ